MHVTVQYKDGVPGALFRTAHQPGWSLAVAT
jgi:hypothetical protein